MFGKRKIQKDGEQAKAVILDAKASSYTNSKGIRKYHLDLRVQFDDGTTEEASCTAYPTGPAGAFMVGTIVPVRYWPKDRTLVEVDRDAMVADARQRRDEGRAGLIRMAEEQLAKGEEQP